MHEIAIGILYLNIRSFIASLTFHIVIVRHICFIISIWLSFEHFLFVHFERCKFWIFHGIFRVHFNICISLIFVNIYTRFVLTQSTRRVQHVEKDLLTLHYNQPDGCNMWRICLPFTTINPTGATCGEGSAYPPLQSTRRVQHVEQDLLTLQYNQPDGCNMWSRICLPSSKSTRRVQHVEQDLLTLQYNQPDGCNMWSRICLPSRGIGLLFSILCFVCCCLHLELFSFLPWRCQFIIEFGCTLGTFSLSFTYCLRSIEEILFI